MARPRMITRTFDLTIGECMCVDVTTQQVRNIEFKIFGIYTDNAKLLEAVKAGYETDTFKVVMVNSAQVGEVLMGMTESEFLQVARVLPPRTKQQNSEDESEVDA